MKSLKIKDMIATNINEQLAISNFYQIDELLGAFAFGFVVFS